MLVCHHKSTKTITTVKINNYLFLDIEVSKLYVSLPGKLKSYDLPKNGESMKS